MNVKEYKVSMEIEGPMAMFADPAYGSTPYTYPVPTWSQAKAIFETICKVESAYIDPTHVEICKPVKRSSYMLNYRGPLRENKSIIKGNSLQRHLEVLIDPCFRIYGIVRKLKDNPQMTTNPEHALQCMFNRNLKRERCRYHPCLGLKECHATYFGHLREDTNEIHVQKGENTILQIMLYCVFNKPRNGAYDPHFKQHVEINEGVLRYDIPDKKFPKSHFRKLWEEKEIV